MGINVYIQSVCYIKHIKIVSHQIKKWTKPLNSYGFVLRSLYDIFWSVDCTAVRS